MSKVISAFSCEHLTVARDGSIAVRDVSVDIPAGSYTAIVGPNGGGKTTLVLAMLGVIAPVSGSVQVFGKPIAAARAELARVGVVPQRLTNIDASFPATVFDVVMSGRTLLPRAERTNDAHHVMESLEAVGLEGFARRRFGELSGGERQRVMLARALACEPRALVLDEPTTYIDAGGQKEFYSFLREYHDKGVTIVLVSHDLDAVVKEADRVVCLDGSVACHGAPLSAVKKAAKIIHSHRDHGE